MRSLFPVLLVAFAACFVSAAAAPAFDPQPWLADLDQTRQVLLTKYANIEWAVDQREANLPALFADTRMRLAHAQSESDARAAFDRLARKIGDEHLAFVWPKQPTGAKATPDRCAALGYDARTRGPLLAADAAGYRPLDTPQSGEFPAGTLISGGTTVGIIKIGVFMPQGFPDLCNAALAALAVPADKPCDDACSDRVDDWVSARLTTDLAAQLRAIEKTGANSLVVDIAGNGGGTEWSEAVARMLSPIRLRSEELRFVRGEHWAKRFSEDGKSLREFESKAFGADRKLLHSLAGEVDARRTEALASCDVTALWQGTQPSCAWLGKGFYGSGMLAAADPATLRGKPWASLLFSPMEFPYEEGVWRGPLIVLIDSGVGSAASEFAAVLQDNKAALIMGAPSGGGCGHTDGGTPTALTNSKAELVVPDCARFRADGTNEAMGIEPDVLVGFTPADGPHLMARRFLEKLPEALDRARSFKYKSETMK
ncbi:MAG TPA: S41 family peptidase [Rhizomicrobium sp.]